MALDVWFKPDVARILTALASAGELRGPEYRRGLEDAALAFGVRLGVPAALAGNEVDALAWQPGAVTLYDER